MSEMNVIIKIIGITAESFGPTPRLPKKKSEYVIAGVVEGEKPIGYSDN